MKITFAGLKTTGKVETVWVVIELGKHQPQDWYYDYVIAWGRRGGKLQSMTRLGYNRPNMVYNYNRYYRYSTIGKLINKKLNKEYESISADRLAEVYPEFEKDLDKLAFWETLKL
jgi:hypothetical protein